MIGRATVVGIQLLEDCLQWDPEKRPTAQQALKYPFFQITKRATDTVHTIPLTTSHIMSQQQQSSIVPSHHHQSTIPNGRTTNMSFASLDNHHVDNNKFTSDAEFMRNYGVASHTTIYPSNGIKQIVMENNRRNSINNHTNGTGNNTIANNNNDNANDNACTIANDFDEDDTIKSMNIVNGKNFSLFNGAFNNSSALLNNHHQPERSLDASANVSQPIGYSSSIGNSANKSNATINNNNNSQKLKQNEMANYRDARQDAVDMGTAISSSTITQTSRDSPMPNSNAFNGHVRQNGNSAITTARIQTNDTVHSVLVHRPANGMKATNELFNGFDSRRNSGTQMDDNPFFKEKISDIFVNRNVGGGGGGGGAAAKLYNGYGGNGYKQKMYSNKVTEVESPIDYGQQKSKSFYLHDAKKPSIDDSIFESADAKVYNIFSKQRLAKSFTQEKNINAGNEENGYLAMKMPTVAGPNKQKTQKSTQMKQQPNWDLFEDDELAKILG